VLERAGQVAFERFGAMFVGTIHGYCFRLLQDHVPKYGNYDVLDEHRHAGLLSREYRSLGLSRLGTRHWRPIRDLMKTVDVLGNELIDPAALAGTPLGEVCADYWAMLERYHFLTFSQLITLAITALEQPVIFQRVHASLRHLIVDEYQDINPAQERLIELLAQAPVQLCVVGDDDQAIYQWRGSDVANIVGFRSRRHDAMAVTLETNRRIRPAHRVVRRDRGGRGPLHRGDDRAAARTRRALPRHRGALSVGAHVGTTAHRGAARAADPVFLRGAHGSLSATRDCAVRRALRVVRRRRVEGRPLRRAAAR
jgi:hypothetical protein